MKVVREHARCDGFERMAFLNGQINPSEAVNLAYQEITRSVGKSDREEKNTTIDLGTTISRHGTRNLSYSSSSVESLRVGTAREERAFAHPTDKRNHANGPGFFRYRLTIASALMNASASMVRVGLKPLMLGWVEEPTMKRLGTSQLWL
jgi:hypothetical protein